VHIRGEYERLFHFCRRELQDTLIAGFGGGMPGYLAALWAKWLGRPSAVLFRGNDFERIIHDPRRAWQIHYILDHATLVAAVSTEMLGRIKTMTNTPAVFTPVGIHAEEWTPQPTDYARALELKKDKPIVGVFGQLKFKKGMNLALALFSSFGFSERAVPMTVGDVSEGLRARLNAECAGVWVEVPYVEAARLPAYYLAADVVLVPSFYDGMPNVLLESMTVGTPVVASTAGGIPDVVEDGVDGFLFEAGDAAGAAAALNRALGLDAPARAAMIAAAGNKVRRSFSAAREADILESALKGIFNGY
jgi:glycosyltransferase involved in cell wall biosynthesis